MLSDNPFEYLRLVVEDDVLTVTLNRPDELNAVNGQLHHEIASLFSGLRDETSVGAIVLTGSGRAFCAGGDVTWFEGASREQIDTLFVQARSLINDFVEIRQPVIAAVNGPAVGLGATLALFCDVIVAADTAYFADPHVLMGVVAGDGGAVIWPLLVGVARAKHYLMTGDRLGAAEAERIGLVNQVVPTDDVVNIAHELAVRLADGPRQAIAGTKSTVNRLVRHALSVAFETGLVLERESMLSDDHREAVTAFAEGRPPRFTGR